MNLNLHSNHKLLFSVIFFGFLALSAIIAIAPAMGVEASMAPLPGSEPLSALEHEGLRVYIAEGCVACHTQQVRPLAMDEVWGRAAVPADFAHVGPLGPWSPYAPALLGSSRTGPDLTNIGARQASETWQYLHLYNPRIVVPDSVMPAYPWLFEVVASAAADDVVVPVSGDRAPADGQVVVGAKGKALVAYLLSLSQGQLDLATGEHPEGGH
ncbi:MAG TPA: cbb3-type cytochrome c oxidase subunit II [Trueperaceae bacterium]|nr:cbb3-type cytochrome c oxidase subunit II [Trueperaceae bacterium]